MRLPRKSRRSDAGDCFRRVRFLKAAIHVGGAEAKRLCVLAWWWKGGALHGGARERSAACARACLQLNELRKATGGGSNNVCPLWSSWQPTARTSEASRCFTLYFFFTLFFEIETYSSKKQNDGTQTMEFCKTITKRRGKKGGEKCLQGGGRGQPGRGQQ
jgi:hypothetical protein